MQSFDDVSNSTARGIITVTKEGTASTFALFKVSGAVTDASGYTKVPVTHVVSSGSFSDDDGVGVHFSYSGADGSGSLSNVVEDTSPQLGGTLDVNSNLIDMNGLADGLVLDADADTTISAPTDDQIDIEIAGADDFTFTANTFTALSGSEIVHADSGSVRNRINNKPLIINGDMNIHQRTTSKTGITSTGLDVQDRFSRVMGGAGTWTQTSDSDVPTGQGFTKSMKWDCTTAAGLSDAGQIFSVRYIWEGQDLQLLKYGTANAEKLTVAFWIKSPKTGTHIVSLYAHDDNRHVSKAYTVASANTWEKHVCSFPADTTGVIDNDTGAGVSLEIGLSAASNYTSGTLATSWASYTAANAYVGQVNCADNTANNVFITGVQVEVGEFTSATIPAFQHESFGDSITRCQRYFQKYTQPPLVGIANANNTYARAKMLLQTQMRTAPTAVHNGTFSYFVSNSIQPTTTAFSATYLDENVAEFDATTNVTSMTAKDPITLIQSGSASLDLSAEI